MAQPGEIQSRTSPDVMVTTSKAPSTDKEYLKEHMPLFDTRVYRTLAIFDKSNHLVNKFYPHYDYGSYVMDFYSTPTAIQQKIEAGGNTKDEGLKKQLEILKEQKKQIEEFNTKHRVEYLSSRSFIHPYALVKLAGSYGSEEVVKKRLTYDRFDKRKFYEIDGEEGFSGNYSKTPTTTSLIRWGQESPRGKTPYSFQDFVFCKWWNKIENNRLITLRRYAMPVTDNIEFADYDIDTNAASNKGSFNVKDKDGKKLVFGGSNATSPFVPLATAVTYFGDDTGNKLSDILSFSAKYNWKELKAEKDPIEISAAQNDEGDNTINAGGGSILGAISSGVGILATTMGFLGEVSDGKTINLEGAPGSAPPDPYSYGPYENRILGPINVITQTYKREKGLEFTGDGLKITFEYIARPIAGINNKAVLLDLLANMLVLTYSSGTWFGGMWRYRSEKPAVYPFKYGDTMNKLYRGKIFGKDGAIESLTKNVFADGGNALSTFLPDAISAISNVFSGAVNAIKSLFTKKGTQEHEQSEEEARASFKRAFETGTMRAIQKVIAAKALKGTTIPFIQHQRALLTGEPVGDWHLTVGNPLNPIAMIGNLIVHNMSVTFFDELGPDDFPIGFKCVVELKHGLGRDRDAIESMFNRGYGRIYTLDDHFRSSADSETRVDKYTGGIEAIKGRLKYEETRNTYYGGGTAFIAGTQSSELKNKGVIYDGDTQQLESLKPTDSNKIKQTVATYYVNPWMMGYTL